MKNLIFALTSLVISASAHARSMRTFVTADLISIQTQAGSALAAQNPIGGEIQVDIFHRHMGLVLNLPGTCPKNVMCIWAGPAPLRYSFDVENVTRGTCGETVIRSKTQPLEEGGPLATLTVTDYTTLVCKYFPAAWVEAELLIHGFIPEVHKMTAEKFR